MSRMLNGRVQPGRSRWMVGVLLAPALLAAPSVSSLTISPGDISGGQSASGTVGITSSPTPTTVNLASSNNQIAKVPATITIRALSTSGSFQAVSASGGAGCPVISAAVEGSATRRVTLFVKPVNNSGSKLNLTLPSSTTVGGTTVNATLSFIEPLGTGSVSVQLASDSPNATVPAKVSLPPGEPNEAGFAVARTTVPITTRDQGTTTCAVITATRDTERSRVLLKIATISG